MSAPDLPDAPEAAAPASAPALPKTSWYSGLARKLLYGNVDRSAKARARVGLAILVFTIGYAVIGGTPRQFTDLIQDGIERYGAIIKSAGIQPE